MEKIKNAKVVEDTIPLQPLNINPETIKVKKK